ncbi:MAG: DNA polymerase III subunit beta [Pseudomonadota bacterium]
MAINTTREDLLFPLQKISGVVERRQTLPILANVLVNVRKDQLTLTATDLEVEMRTSARCSAQDSSDFTIPARKLLDICKALPEASDVTLAVEGERAVVRSGRGRYVLGLLPSQDYPVIEMNVAGEQQFSLSQQTLKKLLERTQFAMAQQDVRYYLNGLLLETEDAVLRTVATDGHRLALDETDDGVENGAKVRIILPRKAVAELHRLLADSADPVQVEVSSNHARFSLGDTVFTSKLIDGRFPDYERVIPHGGSAVMKADREILRQALTRASILSNEKYRGIRFDLKGNNLQLVANNPEQEEAEEEIEVEYSGKDVSMGFNVGYLLDVLNAIDTTEVNFAVTDSNSSCLIRTEPPGKEKYVIMPMRL